MDQAYTLPRSRRSRPPFPIVTGRSGATTPLTARIDGHPVVVDRSGSEVPSDSGEEPESPGHRLASPPPAREIDANADPLAEPIAALLGASLALITLLVPILAVVTTPVESSSKLGQRPASTALSRSRAIEPGPAAALAP